MRVVGVFLAVVAAVKAQEDVYGQYMQQQQQAAPAKQGGGVVGMAVAAGAGGLREHVRIMDGDSISVRRCFDETRERW